MCVKKNFTATFLLFIAETLVTAPVTAATIIAETNIAEHMSTIILMYEERLPYAVKILGNEIIGLTASPAVEAFKNAGIPFISQAVPFELQLTKLQRNQNVCSLGLFLDEQRREYIQYTKAIYQDKAFVVFTRPDVLTNNVNDRATGKAISQANSVVLVADDFLKNDSLKLVIKLGYSYGDYLDQHIKLAHKSAQTTSATNIDMIRNVLNHEADYFFIALEEAQILLYLLGIPQQQYSLVKLNDIPNLQKRYVGCAKSISGEVIDKLNQFIKIDTNTDRQSFL